MDSLPEHPRRDGSSHIFVLSAFILSSVEAGWRYKFVHLCHGWRLDWPWDRLISGVGGTVSRKQVVCDICTLNGAFFELYPVQCKWFTGKRRTKGTKKQGSFFQKWVKIAKKRAFESAMERGFPALLPIVLACGVIVRKRGDGFFGVGCRDRVERAAVFWRRAGQRLGGWRWLSIW